VLWLIWIALMLLVPLGAGVQVWWQLRHAPAKAPEVLCTVGKNEPVVAEESR